MAIGNDGLIYQSQLAAKKYQNAQEDEQLTNILDIMKNNGSNITSVRGNDFEVSNKISNFSPTIVDINKKTITVKAGVTENEESNIKGYIFLLDGKVQSVEKTKTYTFNNLTPDTEYEIEIVAIDEEANFKKSTSVAQRTKVNTVARYFIVDVYDHIDGNGAAINELEFYDANNQKLTYSLLNAYDSSSAGTPSYWNDSVWDKSKLYDNKINYGSNQEGSQTSLVLFFKDRNTGTSANTGYYARFLVDLGQEKEIGNIRIAIGGPELRTPKSVSIYYISTSSYISGTDTGSTYKKNISTRSNDGLNIIHTETFASIVSTPKWYNFETH